MWDLLLISHSVMSDSFATPWTVAHQAPLYPWDSPGKDTGLIWPQNRGLLWNEEC